MESNERLYFGQREKKNAQEVLHIVHDALEEAGYNPIDQLTGYLISDDSSYITNHNDAKKVIRMCDQDEIIEELLRAYFDK